MSFEVTLQWEREWLRCHDRIPQYERIHSIYQMLLVTESQLATESSKVHDYRQLSTKENYIMKFSYLFNMLSQAIFEGYLRHLLRIYLLKEFLVFLIITWPFRGRFICNFYQSLHNRSCNIRNISAKQKIVKLWGKCMQFGRILCQHGEACHFVHILLS